MLSEKLHTYIESLIPGREPLFMEMENYAREHHVPIMELSGIETMLQVLRIQNPQKILEVGTAIGYSALRMASAVPTVSVVTIERDADRFQIAEEFIERSGKLKQITMIKGDALEVEDRVGELGPYDAVFIDAAKGTISKVL